MSSFNFGNTSSSGLGAKSIGFGNSSFGTTCTTATPIFGGPVVSTSPAFAFGAPSSVALGFGSSTSTAPALTTSFGFDAMSASVSTGGFGSFGTTTLSTAATGTGGFNSQPQQQSALTGFGTAVSSVPPQLGGFGTNVTTSTGIGGLGVFGSNFGKPSGGTFNSTFGQQPAQQSAFQMHAAQHYNPQQTADDAFAQSILNVSIFSDERDAVIAKWNYLQAQWGNGKSFYNAQLPALDITPENVLCRFKAMGYSKLPGYDNKLGFVALSIGKPIEQIRAQETNMLDQLRQVFGNRPSISVRVHSARALSDTRGQVIIYVEEKSQTSNETKRITAAEVAAYLQQVLPKQQISSMGIDHVLACVLPDEDQLKEYLETAPKGIDARMWRQAINDNPDVTNLIPVPIIGLNELKWRIKLQETETETHAQYLQQVQNDVAELRQRHSSTIAKIMAHRRKFGDLAHRVLQIIVKQECSRKLGVAQTPEEEMLRSKLENMQALVSAPTQFKGRLSELLSQMRMQRNHWNAFNVTEYTMDKDSFDEMKTFLSMQQKAMAFLIDTVNRDMKSLQIISEGIKDIRN